MAGGAPEVQIFGTKGCADTRRALRFFSDRRLKVHFVDLMERAASKGELKRFAQKFGVEALVDRESKRFQALGLKQAHYGEARWLELLEGEPLLLRTPLGRRGNEVTIGVDEEAWKGWAGR
jgi:arsenate reductase-like glutaredoxin family protein